jgi:hypothetical protein
MMRYKRFASSIMPAGGIGAASDFPPLVLVRLRNKEHERHGAALGARKKGELIGPASDVAVPGPLPIDLVAGAQWCRCSDLIQP